MDTIWWLTFHLNIWYTTNNQHENSSVYLIHLIAKRPSISDLNFTKTFPELLRAPSHGVFSCRTLPALTSRLPIESQYQLVPQWIQLSAIEDATKYEIQAYRAFNATDHGWNCQQFLGVNQEQRWLSAVIPRRTDRLSSHSGKLHITTGPQ